MDKVFKNISSIDAPEFDQRFAAATRCENHDGGKDRFPKRITSCYCYFEGPNDKRTPCREHSSLIYPT